MPGRHARPHRRSGSSKARTVLRYGLLLVTLAGLGVIYAAPADFEPPDFLQSEAEQVSGDFAICGRGRSHYCVVDGDTFKLGSRSVRVVSIDTAENDAACQAEAEQAQASTAALQEWLNRGPFQMTARIDEPTDRYGRDLRIVKRRNRDGSEDRLADFMRSQGGARSYDGGRRDTWC